MEVIKKPELSRSCCQSFKVDQNTIHLNVKWLSILLEQTEYEGLVILKKYFS